MFFLTENGNLEMSEPIYDVEKYVHGESWIKNSVLQNTHYLHKLLIVPNIYSTIFTNDFK